MTDPFVDLFCRAEVRQPTSPCPAPRKPHRRGSPYADLLFQPRIVGTVDGELNQRCPARNEAADRRQGHGLRSGEKNHHCAG